MKFEQFMDALQVKESYQLQNKLMEKLLSDEKDVLFDELIKNGFDTAKDEIREIFEKEVADRKALMQDYTPSCLCKLISLLCSKNDELLDVCCGVGSLSIASLLDNNSNSYVMEELSSMSISLLLLNMSIRNCDAMIYRKDVLTGKVYEVYQLKKQEKYSSIQKVDLDNNQFKKYDCIVSNPPYSLQWNPVDDDRFHNYGLAPKSKADYAFVLDILYRLNENGKAFIILPHGVLFRGSAEEKIRKALICDNVIDCIISLPANLFFNTGIPTIILGLKNNKTDKDVLFIDASRGFEKQGKQNVLRDEDIKKIVDTYSERKQIEKYSKVVSFDEIEKNDFNLNIPRYIDVSEEKEPIDIGKCIDDIICLENDIHDTGIEIAKYLSDLVGGGKEYQDAKKEMIEHLNNKYIHDTSDALEKVYSYICSEENMKHYKQFNLLDIAEFERAKANKVYKKGSILFQLSASKGQLLYLEQDSKVEAKYGVFTAKGVNSKYLYYIMTITFPCLLDIYQTGLNFNPEVFKFFKINIHTDEGIQNNVVVLFDNLEKIEKEYLEEINKLKDFKSYHLEKMFV